MTKNQQSYKSEIDRQSLAGIFEEIYLRLMISPGGESDRTLATFAASLLNSEEFNLAQLDTLPGTDRQLCLRLFDYCMKEGLSEEDRRAAADAIAPFIEMHNPGTRH